MSFSRTIFRIEYYIQLPSTRWIIKIVGYEYKGTLSQKKNRTEGLKIHSNAWMNFSIILVNEKNTQREDILWVSSDVKFWENVKQSTGIEGRQVVDSGSKNKQEEIPRGKWNFCRWCTPSPSSTQGRFCKSIPTKT